ncbi:hypothetical protein IG631_02383 [Alternaria alternata]|nr:hypothetical protein IG631_02383 [Alternaria alternata]
MTGFAILRDAFCGVRHCSSCDRQHSPVIGFRNPVPPAEEQLCPKVPRAINLV